MSHSIDLIVYNMCYVTFQGSSLENYTSNDTIQHDKTRDNTSTRKHNTRQHETTRGNTSATRDNTSTTQDNTSAKQHKIYFDLFILSLYTRILVT